jgi:alkylation response protein AidB-like acyl-CoA dehydrogenase
LERSIGTSNPPPLLKKVKGLQFLEAFINEQHGGAGFGFLEHALILEEFRKVDCGLARELCSVTSGAEEFLLFGTENQKTKYLHGIVSRNEIMGFAPLIPQICSLQNFEC